MDEAARQRRIRYEERHPEFFPANALLDATYDEMENDVWDVRNIPGCKVLPHRSEHTLSFVKVPNTLRPIVKRFMRLQVTTVSFATCRYYIQYLPRFTVFYTALHEGCDSFRDMTRADVEKYIVHVRTTPIRGGADPTVVHVRRSLWSVRSFLSYLECSSAPEAPTIPLGKLMWREDAGRPPKPSSKPKFLPKSILERLDEVMHLLPPDIFPVVALLRASGWRTADVLGLKWDTCLHESSSGWWLCGDISKSNVVDHRIPISKEIAALVRAQCEVVRRRFDDAKNPKRLLFASRRTERSGRSIQSNAVSDALRKLAQTYNIVDAMGTPYHFNLHAFRHTKAMELLQAGHSLPFIQRWLAHTSSDMTQAYAKIMDEDLRKGFLALADNGIVRVDADAGPYTVDIGSMSDKELDFERLRKDLDAVRLDIGFCLKPSDRRCPAQEIACHDCVDFATTKEDLPLWYGKRQHLNDLIVLNERQGRTASAEVNKRNLARCEPIIATLESGLVHHPAGKARREGTQTAPTIARRKKK